MAKMKRWWLWFHRTDPVHLQGYITQSVANVWGGAVIWQLSPIQACRADLQYQTEPTDGAVSSLVAEYGERTVVSTFPGAGQQTSIENSPKNIRLQEGVSGCTGWQAQYPIMGGGGDVHLKRAVPFPRVMTALNWYKSANSLCRNNVSPIQQSGPGRSCRIKLHRIRNQR